MPGSVLPMNGGGAGEGKLPSLARLAMMRAAASRPASTPLSSSGIPSIGQVLVVPVVEAYGLQRQPGRRARRAPPWPRPRPGIRTPPRSDPHTSRTGARSPVRHRARPGGSWPGRWWWPAAAGDPAAAAHPAGSVRRPARWRSACDGVVIPIGDDVGPGETRRRPGARTRSGPQSIVVLSLSQPSLVASMTGKLGGLPRDAPSRRAPLPLKSGSRRKLFSALCVKLRAVSCRGPSDGHDRSAARGSLRDVRAGPPRGRAAQGRRQGEAPGQALPPPRRAPGTAGRAGHPRGAVPAGSGRRTPSSTSTTASTTRSTACAPRWGTRPIARGSSRRSAAMGIASLPPWRRCPRSPRLRPSRPRRRLPPGSRGGRSSSAWRCSRRCCVAAVAWQVWRSRQPDAGPIRSLAVLPFANLSADRGAGVPGRRHHRRADHGAGGDPLASRHLAAIRDPVQGQRQAHARDRPRAGGRRDRGRRGSPEREPRARQRPGHPRSSRSASLGPEFRRGGRRHARAAGRDRPRRRRRRPGDADRARAGALRAGGRRRSRGLRPLPAGPLLLQPPVASTTWRPFCSSA